MGSALQGPNADELRFLAVAVSEHSHRVLQKIQTQEQASRDFWGLERLQTSHINDRRQLAINRDITTHANPVAFGCLLGWLLMTGILLPDVSTYFVVPFSRLGIRVWAWNC